MNTPLISIIIPSFNKEKYIYDTIQSVQNQTYVNWELLVIDDLSSDRTIAIIEAFIEKDNRIKLYVNTENKGANYSRNFGIKQSLGKYIVFLDADDVFSLTCLENRIKAIANTDLDFCVFTMQIFKNSVGDLSSKWIPNSQNPLKDFLSHSLPWQTMQPIWKKEFLLLIGGFDENFKRMQDVELHTRTLFYSNIKFKQVVDEPDCFYRIDEKRLNFKHYDFLERWIDSALLFYYKFQKPAKAIGVDKYLMGTVYKSYLQILNSFKTKKITNTEFEQLKNKLINSELQKGFSFKTQLCFRCGTFFNLLPFRIVGVNFIINRLIVL